MVLDNVFATGSHPGRQHTAARALMVGCEPADFGEKIGLSEPVSRAIPNTIRAVLEIVQGRMASISVSSAGGLGTHRGGVMSLCHSHTDCRSPIVIGLFVADLSSRYRALCAHQPDVERRALPACRYLKSERYLHAQAAQR